MAMDEDEEDAKPAARPSKAAAAAGAAEQSSDTTAATDQSHQTEADVTGELPFLVTHWLSGYHQHSSGASPQQQHPPQQLSEEQAAALRKIQHAASELSSAFCTLGAFGSSARVRPLCLI